jgi:dynein heavy chain
VQVEELVAGSNTGKSPQLAGYYGYWEMAVLNALVLMVLRALEKLHAMLNSAKKPLFKVNIHVHMHMHCGMLAGTVFISQSAACS